MQKSKRTRDNISYDVIKKLIYNIKNVRLHKLATFNAVLLPYCNRVKDTQ